MPTHPSACRLRRHWMIIMPGGGGGGDDIDDGGGGGGHGDNNDGEMTITKMLVLMIVSASRLAPMKHILVHV